MNFWISALLLYLFNIASIMSFLLFLNAIKYKLVNPITSSYKRFSPNAAVSATIVWTLLSVPIHNILSLI